MSGDQPEWLHSLADVPWMISSHEQASPVLDDVGRIQRAISEPGMSAVGAEAAIVERLEAVMAYMLAGGAKFPAQAFDVVIAPASEWGMHQYVTHPDFISDPTSDEATVRKALMTTLGELRAKYQHLNPDNTGGPAGQP